MDIRHCWLSALPGISQEGDKRVVVVAKHLCGLATDLAIHSLGQQSEGGGGERRGCSIATCCHHCCSWADYCGRVWMRGLELPGLEPGQTPDNEVTQPRSGFTQAEFGVLTRWSGWATGLASEWSGRAGSKRERDPNMGGDKEEAVGAEASAGGASIDTSSDRKRKLGKEAPAAAETKEPEKEEKGGHSTVPFGSYPKPEGLTTEERAMTGFMVKRLIDQGRVMYVREALGFRSAQQARFCSPDKSPECYVIMCNSERVE